MGKADFPGTWIYAFIIATFISAAGAFAEPVGARVSIEALKKRMESQPSEISAISHFKDADAGITIKTQFNRKAKRWKQVSTFSGHGNSGITGSIFTQGASQIIFLDFEEKTAAYTPVEGSSMDGAWVKHPDVPNIFALQYLLEGKPFGFTNLVNALVVDPKALGEPVEAISTGSVTLRGIPTEKIVLRTQSGVDLISAYLATSKELNNLVVQLTASGEFNGLPPQGLTVFLTEIRSQVSDEEFKIPAGWTVVK